MRVSMKTREEEDALSREIAEFYAEIRLRLDGIDGTEAILFRRQTAKERTRDGAVKRLREATELVRAMASGDPALCQGVSELDGLWQRVSNAEWTLALSNSGLAYETARRVPQIGLDYGDLVQEGMIGLCRAARRADVSRGIRFGQYAKWWTRAQMTRAIDDCGRTIRVPAGVVEQYRKVRRTRARRSAQCQSLSDEAVAEECGLSVERLRDVSATVEFVSLDDVRKEDGKPLGEILVANGDPQDDQLVVAERAVLLRRNLARLHGRRPLILTMMYGLDGGDPMSQGEVARKLGVSRTRIGQLHEQSITLLRKWVDEGI